MKKLLLFFVGLLGVCCLCYYLFFNYSIIRATAYNNTVYSLEGEYRIHKGDKIYKSGTFTLTSGNSLSIEQKLLNTDEVEVTFEAKNSTDEEAVLRWVYNLDEDSNVSIEFDETQNAITNKDESLHFIFQDPEMLVLLPNPQSENYLLELESKLSIAKELRASLHRQMWFSSNFKNPDSDYPFMLTYLEDDNSYSQQGVRISGLYRKFTIKGEELSLQPGDIIMAMDQPVYNGADLYVQLYNHAMDETKGIESPLNLKIIRNSEVYSVQTTYFFNEAYALHLNDTKLDAATAGLFHSIFYGKSNVVIAGVKKTTAWLKNVLNNENDKLPEFKKESWLATQREYRLRQKHSKAFGRGSLLGLFGSPLQGLSKSTARIIAKTGVPKVGARIVASTLIETAEGAYYMYNDASVLTTKEEKLAAAIGAVPESLGIGLVIGTVLTR